MSGSFEKTKSQSASAALVATDCIDPNVNQEFLTEATSVHSLPEIEVVPTPFVRVYGGQTIGRHHDHSHPEETFVAGRQLLPRSGTAIAMYRSGEAVGHGVPQSPHRTCIFSRSSV